MTRARRNVAAGALGWAAFCVAVVVARGVRWDETYEFAQVILGAVKHPAGHPLAPYVRNAYSLQVYLSAAVLWATGSAFFLNAFRNFLFILATVMPAYLLGARLSGRALYGHAAALLVLAGVHLELRSTYPQFVWPDIFSNGHIGTAWALLAVLCFASRWWRASFLLLGMMPCIHVGQAPPVLALGAAAGAWLAYSGRRRELKQGLVYFGIGTAVCAAFWLAQRPFVMATATEGPYGVTGDVEGIWKGFVALHDIHRSWPPINGQVGLGLLLALSGLMTYATWKPRGNTGKDGTVWGAVFVYAAAIGGAVWASMAVHAAMGAETPRIVLQWMPYRLLNHVPPLLVAALCGVLASPASRSAATGRMTATAAISNGVIPRSHTAFRVTTWESPGYSCLALAVLALAVALPYTRDAWPELVYTRYLAPSAGLVYILVGAALFVAAEQAFGAPMRAAAAAVALACVVAAFHQFGGACVLAGGAVAFATTSWRERSEGKGATPQWAYAAGAAAIMIYAGGVFLYQQSMQRQVLPVSGFERSVESYLAARGDKDAMLVGGPKQLLLQAKTNHAVITDMALPYMITYLPSIGPAVSKLYEDVYGIRFTDAGPGDWERAWAERPTERWRELGKLYSFRYVVAPSTIRLNLREALADAGNRLYAIE